MSAITTLNDTTTAQSTVRIKTNESNLIANLGSVFSKSDKVLAEFMQNARRAHATEIRFSMQDDTLIVEDNGDGISDLQNLFTIAESGWDDATMQADRPFGLGFLSSLFSADAVQVESRGKMVAFNTADMIEMQAIPINTSEYIGTTRITLFGFKLNNTAVQTSLKGYARGFPIRVYLDGTEFDRPHAMDNIHSSFSEIGQLCLSGIDFEGEEFAANAYLYIQGLPVSCQGMSQHYQQNIIHLNRDFKVRMPDRDSLIDPGTSLKTIKQAIASRWLAYLLERKALESHETFVERYRAIKLFEYTHLLNDVPLLPSACFDVLDGTPSRSEVNVMRKLPCKADNHIRRQDIESGLKIVCKHVDNYLDTGYLNGKAFAALLFAARKQWLMLDNTRRLHPDHWIHKHV
ncbi:MAG TPA: ATP-binding protein, partial [Burkholderiaceae bacterium]|nr:ATP-binding protein [Burkholderiaceae bacterium]